MTLIASRRNNQDDTRINSFIKSPEVRLITEKGEQFGIVSISRALNMAESAGLDLVEIAENSKPPVCKILDYGKYRYEKEKQKKINKKKQHIIQVKEIRLDHDLITKLTKAQKFLANGDKLKITVMFRGREMARQQAGHELIRRVVDILEEVAKVDKAANLEGRRMSVILSPR